jgi:hypothetical protein
MCGVRIKQEGGGHNPPPNCPSRLPQPTPGDIPHCPTSPSPHRHGPFIGRRCLPFYASAGDSLILVALAVVFVQSSTMMPAYRSTLLQTTFFLQPETRYLHRQCLALVAGFGRLSPITLQEVVLLIALGYGEQPCLVPNSVDCSNHAFLLGRSMATSSKSPRANCTLTTSVAQC